MKNIWGHRIVRPPPSVNVDAELTGDRRAQADRPTEKAYRSSYRASVNGALVHDASYLQYIELKGHEPALQALFEQNFDPNSTSPCSKRFVLFSVCRNPRLIDDTGQVLFRRSRMPHAHLRLVVLALDAPRARNDHLGRAPARVALADQRATAGADPAAPGHLHRRVERALGLARSAGRQRDWDPPVGQGAAHV